MRPLSPKKLLRLGVLMQRRWRVQSTLGPVIGEFVLKHSLLEMFAIDGALKTALSLAMPKANERQDSDVGINILTYFMAPNCNPSSVVPTSCS